MRHKVCDRSQDAKPSLHELLKGLQRGGSRAQAVGRAELPRAEARLLDVQRDTVVSSGPRSETVQAGDYKRRVRKTRTFLNVGPRAPRKPEGRAACLCVKRWTHRTSDTESLSKSHFIVIVNDYLGVY